MMRSSNGRDRARDRSANCSFESNRRCLCQWKETHPISLTGLMVASTVAGAAGTGINAAGAYEAGQAKAAAASYQAQVAANNAQIAQQDARLDIQSGEVRASNQGLKTRAVVGQEKAAQGLPALTLIPAARSTRAPERPSSAISMPSPSGSDAAKKAYRDEVEAMSNTAQGQLLQTESQQDIEAGDLGAAGTLISGASTVEGQSVQFQRKFGQPRGTCKLLAKAQIHGEVRSPGYIFTLDDGERGPHKTRGAVDVDLGEFIKRPNSRRARAINQSRAEAMVSAGYSYHRGNQNRLAQAPDVIARIEEIKRAADEVVDLRKLVAAAF